MGFCSCISLGKNRIQHNEEVKVEYLGPHGFEKTISSPRGVDLHAYFWPAEPKGTPRGVVQLLHGLCTHTEFDFLKYQAAGKPHVYEGSWVQEMNNHGYAVCGFDFQGFGRSDGSRAYAKRFDDYVDDAIQFVRHLRLGGEVSFPTEGAPYFLLGYSLGGLVGVVASLRQPSWFAGLLLLSPMLYMEERSKKTKRFLLKMASTMTPRLRVSVTVEEVPIDWIKEAWKEDALVEDGKVRARTAEEFFLATERLSAEDDDEAPGMGMGCVSVPLLVFQGKDDTLAEAAGAKLLVERAATHDKRLRTVEAWHVLIKEEGNEEILAEAVQWLDEHCRTERTKGLFGGATVDGVPAAPPPPPPPQAEEPEDEAATAAAAGADELPGAVNGGNAEEEPGAGEIAPQTGGDGDDDAGDDDGDEMAVVAAAADDGSSSSSGRGRAPAAGSDPTNWDEQAVGRGTGPTNWDEQPVGRGTGPTNWDEQPVGRGTGPTSWDEQPVGRGTGPTNWDEQPVGGRHRDEGDSSEGSSAGSKGFRQSYDPNDFLNRRWGDGAYGDNDDGEQAYGRPSSSLPPIGHGRFAPLPPINR